jgi:hypothetical protein
MARLRTMWQAPCGLLAAACLASCSLRLPIDEAPVRRTEVRMTGKTTPAAVRDPDVLVWLIADRYHTGLVVPYDWLLESGFIPPAGFGNPRHVVMSWGNRDAYSAEGFDHPWKVFRVLFTPTRSVMELIPVDWDIAEVIPEQRIWRKLAPRERGPELAHFLNDCSAMGDDGRPVVVCESSWGNGVQLESRHFYFIPRVCNIWTIQALEAIGGDFKAWSGITAKGLIRQAEKPENGYELIWPGGGVPERPTDH